MSNDGVPIHEFHVVFVRRTPNVYAKSPCPMRSTIHRNGVLHHGISHGNSLPTAIYELLNITPTHRARKLNFKSQKSRSTNILFAVRIIAWHCWLIVLFVIITFSDHYRSFTSPNTYIFYILCLGIFAFLSLLMFIVSNINDRAAPASRFYTLRNTSNTLRLNDWSLVIVTQHWK